MRLGPALPIATSCWPFAIGSNGKLGRKFASPSTPTPVRTVTSPRFYQASSLGVPWSTLAWPCRFREGVQYLFCAHAHDERGDATPNLSRAPIGAPSIAPLGQFFWPSPT